MSLYAHLEIHTGIQMAPVSSTLNVYGWVALIFRAAGVNLPSLHGALGEQVIPVLEDAVVSIRRQEFDFLRSYSREAYETAKRFLDDLLTDCKAHPKAVLSVQN